MAGAFIEASINHEEVQNLFKAITAKTDNMRPAFQIIGEEVVKSVRENFLASGRPQRWKPLSTATNWNLIGGNKGYTKGGVAKGRLKSGAVKKLANKRILISEGMRGGLMGSIHYIANPLDVQIGTDKIYGAVHQFGIRKNVTANVTRRLKTVFGTRSSAVTKYRYTRFMSIEARPYLMVQDKDWLTMKRVLVDYFFD